MQTNHATVRNEASLTILWKWTGVSAVLHAILIASLCGVSYLGFHRRELASKAKAAAEEAAANKAAAAASTPTPAASNSPAASATPAATTTPAPATSDASPPVQAEKVLGIDKTAKPEDLPSSPFSTKGDDVLKDLK